MKLLGGILLVVGTAIGGGMLALPIATSPAGFISSSLLLFVCWALMTVSAFLILEANLWLPKNSHIISMVKATIGVRGKAIAWLSYLLLLYSLLSAYIAGGSDVFDNLLRIIHIVLPSWITLVIFTLILGFVVYQGIRSVDLVNRGLMFLKLGAFIILVSLIIPFIDTSKLAGGEFKSIKMSITVAITSFGYATIIPSLRIYFNDDVKKLRIVIWAGSLIPLICYIIWNMAMMGVISKEGDNGLIAMLHSGRSTSESVNQLSALLNRDAITSVARVFTSVCLLTSFLGVALCLSDFLYDGLNLEKAGTDKLIISALTFIPPLFVVIFYPGAFITALSYAGIFCVILLLVFPALMVWYGRYVRKLPQHSFQVGGGKILLVFLISIAALILINSVFEIIS